MKRIVLMLILVALVISISGCLGGDGEPKVNNYSEITNSASGTSAENYSNYVNNISTSPNKIQMTLGSYASASNFNMLIKDVYIERDRLYVEAEISQSSEIGNTVITNIEKTISVNGENLNSTEEVVFDVENSMEEERVTKSLD